MNYNPFEEYAMEEIRERRNYNPFEEEEIGEMEEIGERRVRDERVRGMELGTDAWEEGLKAEARGLRKIDAEMRLELERVSDRYMEVWKAIEKCQRERRRRERPGIGPGDEEIAEEIENEDPEMKMLRRYAEFIVARAKGEKEMNRLTAEFENRYKLIGEQKAEAERIKKVSEEIVLKFTNDTSMELIQVLLLEAKNPASRLSASELAEALEDHLARARQQIREVPSDLLKEDVKTELDEDFSETENVIKKLRRLAREEEAAAAREKELEKKVSEDERRLEEAERRCREYREEKARKREEELRRREEEKAKEREEELKRQYEEEVKRGQEELKRLRMQEEARFSKLREVEAETQEMQEKLPVQVSAKLTDDELTKLRRDNKKIKGERFGDDGVLKADGNGRINCMFHRKEANELLLHKYWKDATWKNSSQSLRVDLAAGSSEIVPLHQRDEQLDILQILEYNKQCIVVDCIGDVHITNNGLQTKVKDVRFRNEYDTGIGAIEFSRSRIAVLAGNQLYGVDDAKRTRLIRIDLDANYETERLDQTDEINAFCAHRSEIACLSTNGRLWIGNRLSIHIDNEEGRADFTAIAASEQYILASAHNQETKMQTLFVFDSDLKEVSRTTVAEKYFCHLLQPFWKSARLYIVSLSIQYSAHLFVLNGPIEHLTTVETPYDNYGILIIGDELVICGQTDANKPLLLKVRLNLNC